MSIVDIVIVLILILYILKGFRNGAIKELVTAVGGAAVIVIAFLAKNPLSVYLYEHLPFWQFKGILSGISVLNIIIYELLAFLIIACVLMMLYSIILSATNLLNRLLKLTVILEVPSKIIGAVIGFVEGVVVVFIALFICMNVPDIKTYIEESKLGEPILTKTPILASASEPIYNSVIEIHDVAERYKDNSDRNAANLEALDILLKYKMLDIDNADNLVKSGKLNIDNIESVLAKYR